LPIVVTVAVRTSVAPSRLMIPLAFGCLTGSKLTLLGTPVNLIASTQADEAGVGHIGFFEWSVLGIPLLAGTIVIVLLFGKLLLPERRSRSIPVDFSAHAQTLVEQYNLEGDADALLNRGSGLAEVVIPARSTLVGEAMFPGMATEDGQLIILAIQRGGSDMPPEPVALRAGDHLLLQGTWKALDQYLTDPKVLVVDSPEAVQKQAVALGHGAPAAIAILLLLVVLLAFNIVPAPVAAVFCAALMVIARVLTLPQLYRGIDWNICILIGAMIPPATAMTKTGAAALIGDYVVNALGGAGPHVVLAGIFVVTAVITQFISNTSSALVMMPIGIATASELGVNALPMMMGVAMGASASFLTPFANGVSAMVYGPGAYKFGDFWKIGGLVTIWALIVTVLIVPLFWNF
jgi:di/tricarboxylate transporter